MNRTAFVAPADRWSQPLLMALSLAVIPGAAASQEIPRDEYLTMLPLSVPRLGPQTEASVELQLFGDPTAPGYRDVDPVDGIDDRRGELFQALAVRFAPYLVQNTIDVPMNFEVFMANRDVFPLTVDRWRTSDEEAELVDSAAVNFSALGTATCDPANRDDALQRFPGAGSDPAVEDCKLLALMDRYTPGAGIMDSRDQSLVRGEADRFEVLYFNFPGEGESNWADLAYRQEWELTPPERRGEFMHAYVHPFLRELEEGGYELLLQYWFFYPTNDSGMDHEGDWEHINVVVSPRSLVTEGLDADVVEAILDGEYSLEDDAQDPLVIRRVDYYFHEFVWPLDFSRPNVYLPRAEWEAQVESLPKTRYRADRIWEELRHMAYVDDAETVVNTHPLGYIGADNKGLNQALRAPGGSNQEPHGTYPFPGRYNNVGPGGTTDQVARYVDIREHLREVAAGRVPDDGPTFENQAVISLVDPARLRIVPDWERVADLARERPEVRRDWAWLLLPIRWGYPATRSPFAGVLEHYNTGNVAPQGPSFNAGWNTSGASSGFSLYEPHSLPSVFPLQVQDNFKNSWGFLNLTVPLFLNAPPLDFISRLVAYPFTALLGRKDPVYYPRDGLPYRFVGLSAGVTANRQDEAFRALALNPEQRGEFVERLVAHVEDNGGPEEPTVITTRNTRSQNVSPFGQVAFYIGDRFVSENTVRQIRSDFGWQVDFEEVPTYDYSAEINYWEYAGSVRYNILTEAWQPFVKGGYGWSWYRIENARSNGESFTPEDSEWFKPGWWPSVWHYGLGIEWVPWRRVGVDGGGFEMAVRAEWTRSHQTLDIDFSDIPLSELEILFPTLAEVPSSTGVHRDDFLFGLSVTF